MSAKYREVAPFRRRPNAHSRVPGVKNRRRRRAASCRAAGNTLGGSRPADRSAEPYARRAVEPERRARGRAARAARIFWNRAAGRDVRRETARDCSLSSTKRAEINVVAKRSSRDAAMNTDWTRLAADLERLLKLRSIPFGMKLFERRAEMEAIPRIRRPRAVHTLDQIVAQAARLGWTVGLAKDDKWRSGEHMVGVWYSTLDDAAAHQAAMECVPDGRYQALAVAPLAGGRLDPPDIALFYATPGAMIYFINGLQWSGYKRFDWSIVGESACADSWGRALKTREPSLSIPCFAERRYGGVLDDEMLMALPPDYLGKAIAGMEALAKNGLRYPFPQYGIQQDVRAGMTVSYPGRGS